MIKALVAIKNVYKFGSGHVTAVSTIMKLPITLDSLLKRMSVLAEQYNQEAKPQVFDLSKGKEVARSALKGTGGLGDDFQSSRYFTQ